MPGEAEISFEEAAGGTLLPHTSAVSPSTGEISFAEAAGPVQPSGPSFTDKLAEGYEFFQRSEALKTRVGEESRRQLFTSIVGDVEEKPGEGFAAHTGKSILRGIQALVTSPAKTAVGGIKATASGVIGLGESTIAGFRGLGRLGGEALVKETVGRIPVSRATAPIAGAISRAAEAQPLSAAVGEMESSMQQTAKMREIASQITKINLAPENEQEQAAEGLLMLIPEGIAAAGDTVYEKTGNALAGAGTQGLLTIFSLHPSFAGKVIKSIKPGSKASVTLDALAVTEPETAKAIADHIEPSDPKTAKKLRVRFNEATGKFEPVELGKKTVEAATQGKEITAEEAGIGLSEAAAETPQIPPTKPKAKPVEPKPELIVDEDTGQFEIKSPAGEFLAQESGKYLQVKRSDVVAAARGQGHAQIAMSMLADEAAKRGLTLASDFSVSKDAQRVYEALAKKGFEVKENPSTPGVEGSKVSTNPRVPVYEVTRKVAAPVSEAELVAPPIEAAKADQIFVSGPTLDSLPGGQFIKGKLQAWYEEIIKTIAPEALGPEAKQSAAVVANKIAESMNKDAANHGMARERLAFWNSMRPADVDAFIKTYETGGKFKDPVLQKAAEQIRQRNSDIYAQDQKVGIKYDPIDSYLYHVFEESDKVAAFFEAKYGAKWGDPKFVKDRSFDLYEEAVKAGFRPKFTNPEEIMLARQHASDIAQMKAEILRDLESYGLAKKKLKGDADPPKDSSYVYRRSPTGEGYWVESNADVILHNAFDTKSLWSMAGIRGDVFRGAMFLKNTTVPIKLALSLFHPLHVATIDNATGMVRASKALLSGDISPVKWLGQMIEAGTYGAKGIPFKGIWDNPRLGSRILRAYQGKIDPSKLTAADTLSLQYMAEGGMIPEMSAQFRIGAVDNFKKAIAQIRAEYPGKGGIGRAAGPAAKTAWYLPFAIIEALQRPMFQVWIPSLKIASYLKDVQTALKADPTLASDKGRRLLALRKISKSVDNRYGEMAYNTLFWNRMIKDIAVANTLSLGWNLGFIREYGGGVLDIGQAAFKKGSIAQKAKAGTLDRPLFVSFYTIQSLLYGGLLTWAFTGQTPSDLIDYIYPKNGNKTPSGEDERMTTMFYAREFAAISKHIEHEGAISGLSKLVANKASGVVGMVKQWVTGLDWRDQEIRDPNSPWHQQMVDTLKATLVDLEPISVKSARESERSAKDIALSVAGFSKAPRYVTQSKTEAGISTLYKKYYAPKQTPYETALLSGDRRQLAKFYTEGKVEEYSNLLDEMMVKYDLTAQEQAQLARNIMRKGVDFNPSLAMFERLTWQQQKRLLDEMSEEERAIYLPRSNKQHLRYTYEAEEAD